MVSVNVLAMTAVWDEAPELTVTVVARTRASPLAVISLPPSEPEAPQLPVVAPVEASPAAKVTALPVSAMYLKVQVALIAQPPEVAPVCIKSITSNIPLLNMTLWTELQVV